MPERRDRLDRAIAALDGIDALLVTNLVNVRYLTGYTGTNGIVVLSRERAVFVTDFRYADGVEPLRALLDVVVLERDIAGLTVEGLGEYAPGCARVGFEGALPYALADRLRGMTPSGVELVLADGIIEDLRIVKSDTEIAASRHAADILEVVYADIANGTLVGRTEADVAWQIERTIREAGFPALSFESIVAAGANGARPHCEPGPTVIARGDLVTVDIGARGGEICQETAQAIAHRAHFIHARHGTQRVDAGLDIFDAGGGIEAIHQVQRRFPFGVALVRQFDAGLQPPEQVWRQRDIALRRQGVGDAPHHRVDTKDLLDDHDAGAAARSGSGEIALHAPPDCDHALTWRGKDSSCASSAVPVMGGEAMVPWQT